MKLSLRRKLGYIHVCGGKLVRVVEEHMFRPHLSQEQDDAPTDRLVAVPGDLAIEVLNYRKKKRVAFQYLTGAAAKSNYYGPSMESWFEPAALRRLDIPTPETWSGSRNAFVRRCIELLSGAQFDPAVDVAIFEISAQDPPSEVAKTLLKMMSYAPTGDTGEPRRHGHVYGKIHRKKEFALVHAQPPRDATGEGNDTTTPFQVGLMLSSCFAKT